MDFTSGSAILSHDAAALEARYAALGTRALLTTLIRDVFPGRIALVSSFGIASALLLDVVARIDPATPVLFLDTGKLFDETLRYRDALTARLGLTDVRSLRPDPASLARHDPDGTLWADRADLCCAVRKVGPLAAGLAGFDAWINGRRRDQGGERGAIPVFEAAGGRIKVNPLAHWRQGDVAAGRAAHGLPRHPLEADGYRSVGCAPCTDRTLPGEGERAGRWRGSAKTECGIHLPAAAPSGAA